MIRIKKILYTTDFSDSSLCVFPQAVYLANKYNAELHMLHAIVLHALDPLNPEDKFPEFDNLVRLFKKNAKKRMDYEILNADLKNLNVVKAQERGFSAAPVILDYCKKNKIDLIVMGTHGRRGIEHLFMGSVAEEVVRLAENPVLTVRKSDDLMPIASKKKILVPIDFSIHSKTALKYALKIAPTYNAKLQMLHVVEESIHPAFYASGINSIFEINSQLKSRSKEVIREMLDSVGGKEVEADIFVVEGRASSEIIKFAEEKSSDLIIISTHGLTGIEHLLLGSVTEKVVRMAKCPVLTVKVFGKSLL